MLEMEIVFSESSKATKTKIFDFLKEDSDALTKQWVKVTIHKSGNVGGRYFSTTHISPLHLGRADETAEIAAGQCGISAFSAHPSFVPFPTPAQFPHSREENFIYQWLK
jgi:hypothetical protein